MGREIVYCSHCEKQIPPGGLHEGRYFLVREEPCCMDCYDELPDNIREGSIQLFVPETRRKRATTTLPGQVQAAKEESERVETDFDSGGDSFKKVLGLAAAIFLLVAIAAFFLLRGC